LIQYHISNNNNKKALEIAQDWMKQNNYDYAAKFAYADVLGLNSKELAEKYYAKLHTEHKEISSITKIYITFLLKNKNYNRAKAVENEFNKHHTKSINANLKMYYLDQNHSKYSEQASIDIKVLKQFKNGTMELLVSKDFNLLSGIRLDINKAPIGTTIKNLSIEIETNDNNYSNIKFKTAHDLRQLTASVYETLGFDPFFYLESPEDLKSYHGTVKIKIHLGLNNPINLTKNAIQKIIQVDN